VKPFIYAMGIEANGLAKMQEHIGIEPSGLAFNEVSLNADDLPHNPMVNAGAIAATSLIGRGLEPADAFRSFMDKLSDLAGGERPGFSQTTYLSEIETAFRNNALLYYMEQHGVFPHDCNPDDVLDMYIQACAVEVDTHRASIMAATLANGGVCPTTDRTCLQPTTVKATLTLMFSCGMYDYSGHWMSYVGVPAKSGVAGLVYCVIPNVAGIAVWSPPLDSHGNSVRAVMFFERLLQQFNYGIFDKVVANGLAGFNSVKLVKRLLSLGEGATSNAAVWARDVRGLKGPAGRSDGKIRPSPLARKAPASAATAAAAKPNLDFDAMVAAMDNGGTEARPLSTGSGPSPHEMAADFSGAHPPLHGHAQASVAMHPTDPGQTAALATISHRATFYHVMVSLGEVYRHFRDLWRWHPSPAHMRAGKEIARLVVDASRHKRTESSKRVSSGPVKSPSPRSVAGAAAAAATERAAAAAAAAAGQPLRAARQLAQGRSRIDSFASDDDPALGSGGALANIFAGDGVEQQGTFGGIGGGAIPDDGSAVTEAAAALPHDSEDEADAAVAVLSAEHIAFNQPQAGQPVRCAPLAKLGALLAVSGIMATPKGHRHAFNLLVEAHMNSGGEGMVSMPALLKVCPGEPNLLLHMLMHSLAMPQFSNFTDTLTAMANSASSLVDHLLDPSTALGPSILGENVPPMPDSADEEDMPAVQQQTPWGAGGGDKGQNLGAESISARPIRTAQDVLGVLRSLNRNFDEQFVVSVCTVDGQQFTFGNNARATRARVPLMETVKPLLYAMALHDAGHKEVHQWVDIEPTSTGADGFELLTPSTHGASDGPSPPPKPYNPFTLSGALCVSALVGKGHMPAEERMFTDSGGRFDHIRNTIAKWAGAGKVGFNNPMFLALKRRALRAVALSHYLKGMQCYPERTAPDDNAFLYYQAMCMEMSVSQLAVIAGTLANTGVCPLTQEACLHPGVTKSALSLLYSCGLNAYGGKWDFNIGVPATCGSSGCLMVVMPGVMGMVVQNRALNEYNVPLRGLVLSALLTARFRLNLFDQLVYGDEDIAIAPAQRPQHKTQIDVSSTVLFFELCTAAAAGDVRKVLLLLRWGASVTLGDYDQRTALHIACSDGQADVAKVLILRGAPLNVRDRWGVSPADDAKRVGLWSTIQLMEQVESGQVRLQTRRNPATGTVEHVTPLAGALAAPPVRSSGPWDLPAAGSGLAGVVQAVASRGHKG